MRKIKTVKNVVGSLLCAAVLASCAAAPSETAELSSSEAPAETTTEVAMPVTETPQLEGYNLLWSDEFDGDTLNESIWNRECREPGWTNNELQEYTSSDDNIYVQDGCLCLRAIREDRDGTPYYTSGKVNSQNNAQFQYGRVEVRARVPEGQGLWPAIWMMPQDESFYGQWPKCGEIDIMEVLCNDTTTSYSTIHYGEPHAEQQGLIRLDSGSFSEDFHVFAVEWEPGEMRFYTDDQLVLTVNDWFTSDGSTDQPYPAPFNQPFFVQLNLAVGGDWPGNPDATTDFDNAVFQIDYVRVYQRDEYDMNVERPPMEFREATDDGNFIYNSDFSVSEPLNDETDWFFLLFNDGVGEARIEDNMIIVTSENDGTEEYSVQLVQPDLPVINGHTYRLTFDIRAEEARDVVVCVSAPRAGWIRYLQDTTIDIGTEWQTFEFEFTSNERDDNYGRLEFNMGNHGYTSTVYITNVRYEDITE